MEFIVSARKYRPVTFMSVVGQAHITTTLKNAIKNQQLAHAYLFCGSRGVGKTTCARIFAKTINCLNIKPDFEACNECESCKSFIENRSYNIHELDAASNNSVDDIRLLIDKVRVPPQIGKYSVYIIDEVHMLSQAAFNAFLKTLEEPPRHAIFILATTEKHKILPTILSRCQIFDFNRISILDAANHLKYVAQSEDITVEDEGLNVIAQKADGAMRDALSIFDQIVAFSGKSITYKNVIENLNVLDYDYYFRLTDAFLREDMVESILIFDEILKNGFDVYHFVTGLSAHFRDLLVCKNPQSVKLLEVGSTIGERYKMQSQNASIDFIYEALEVCTSTELQFKNAKNKRLFVEFSLVKLSRLVSEKKKLELTSRQVANQAGTSALPNAFTPKGNSAVPSSIKSVSINALANDGALPAAPYQTSNVQTGNGDHDIDPAWNSPVDDAIIRTAWLEYASSVQMTNPYLYTILSNQIPKVSNGTTLVLGLKDSMQEDEVTKGKPSIFTFLKKRVKNARLTLEIQIVEEKPSEAKVYTASDKMRVMVEQNPSLAELKRLFDLDLE
ncbi:MAG: DNA polymerase III subunit gamma/tau [Breznakibacter sp.]